MTGTSFSVDCFGKSTQLLRCKSWFLTHFHSDHYKGLRASFKQGTLASQTFCHLSACLSRFADSASTLSVTEREPLFSVRAGGLGVCA